MISSTENPPLENKSYIETLCMACNDSSCDFKPIKLFRRSMGDEDIVVEMKYCGVCHTDLHRSAGHLNAIGAPTQYPCVPGHELCGIVSNIGKSVKGFKIGDAVGIGCMVDSCLACKECLAGNEHKCLKEMTSTYQDSNKFGRAAVYPPDSKTLGGYTSVMVIHFKFAILIPSTYPLDMAGPVMCAGVTMYSPLSTYGVKQGSKVGIVGLGGLGQMGIKIAKSMGAIVTVISTSSSKKQLALNLGADEFIISSDKASITSGKGKLDLILNTIPSYHDYMMYQSLLTASKGIQIILGLHAGLAAAMIVDKIVGGTSRVKISVIGSIKETQDVINLCDKYKIYPEIVVVPVSEINNVYTELDKSNATAVRYVLDIANTLKEDVICSKPPTITPAINEMTTCSILTECCGLLCCCRWC